MVFISLFSVLFFSPPVITILIVPVILYIILAKMPIPNELFGYLKTRIITGIVIVVFILLTTYFSESILNQINLSEWRTFFLRIFSEVCISVTVGGIAFLVLIIGNYKESNINKKGEDQ